MKVRHITIFMMWMTLAYSAPTRNFTLSLNVSTTTTDMPRGLTPAKPSLRSDADKTPGRCCSSDPSKKCCPYDYDDNKCEISDNRTLCGYNKNKEKPVEIKTTTIKYGLICWPVNDRLECGYSKGSAISEATTKTTTTTSKAPSVTTTKSPTKPTTTSKTTTTTTPKSTTTTAPKSTTTTTSKPTTITPKPTMITTAKPTMTTTAKPTIITPKLTTTTYRRTTTTTENEESTRMQRLHHRSTQRKQPTSSAPCITVEERCVITYENPCIMVSPCQTDNDGEE